MIYEVFKGERSFHYLSSAFLLPSQITLANFCFAKHLLAWSLSFTQCKKTVVITWTIHDEQGIGIAFGIFHYHFHYNVGKLFIGNLDKAVHIYQTKPQRLYANSSTFSATWVISVSSSLKAPFIKQRSLTVKD